MSTSPSPVRVVLGERHPQMREILARTITRDGACTIVGEATDCDEVLTMSTELKPDVVLLDLYLAGLIGSTGQNYLFSHPGRSSVVVLSSHDEAEFVIRALKCGARGFILKHNADEEVVTALKVVHGGGIFVSAELWSDLIHLLP